MSMKPVRIVLATHNAGKVRELADPIARFGVEVLGLESFPDIGEIDETGVTFEENACITAREVARLTQHTQAHARTGRRARWQTGLPLCEQHGLRSP